MAIEPLPALAFIGGGNMAKALIGGLLAGPGPHPPIRVSDPSCAQRAELQSSHPSLTVVSDNAEAVEGAGLWVLAVKPQQMRAVATGLAARAAADRPLVVSVAAGIRAADLCRWLGAEATVVRAMPNRPALVGAGVTALYSPRPLGESQHASVVALLGAVGRLVWLQSDAEVDIATAVSGSGPAYFLRLIELVADAGAALGLPADVARTLALETALGTARLAAGSTRSCAELRAEVTSSGGTTAAALAVLEAKDLHGIVHAAVAAASARAAELADEFGGG